MPAGKEDIQGLHPLFIMKKSDGKIIIINMLALH
jgi:hypothetical protein